MATNFIVKMGELDLSHLHSSPWYSKTDWNIIIPISKGSMAIISVHRMQI